jgi:MYXO-CTERM domain-containing protein
MTMPRVLGRVLRTSLLLAFSLIATRATANGKFPSADQLVVDPGDPQHLAMMSTFGVLTSTAPAEAWDVICESAAMYSDYEPAVALTSAGTLLLALNEGVGLGRDGGCGWEIASGITTPVVDVTQSAAEPGTAVVITTFAADSGYWTSSDDGASFQQVSALPAGFAALTVDVAPTDAMRVYVSGIDVPGGELGQLARSDDGGATWTVSPIPGSDNEFAPFIGAMDPTDADRLYVRLTGPGVLLTTDDGGQTWTEIFNSPMNKLLGLAVSPDGGTVVVGTEFDGVHRASTSDFRFGKISEVAVRCLTWTDDALYACVNEFLYNDGYIVGRSLDAGDSYEPLVSLACIRGMLDCDAGTATGDLCPARWPDLAAQLKSDSCGQVPTGSGGAGGMPGVGGGGSGAGGGTTDSGDGGGCGCRIEAARTGTSRWSLMLAFAVLLGARRRRVVSRWSWRADENVSGLMKHH